MSQPAMCRHCQSGPANRPRGLCWVCYYQPGVRDRYPSTSKFARRGLGNFNGVSALPSPTKAPPGSPEKVAVLEQRALARLSLWHPLDAPMDSERRATSSPAPGGLACATGRER